MIIIYLKINGYRVYKNLKKILISNLKILYFCEKSK
jgi:hypothetical protein